MPAGRAQDQELGNDASEAQAGVAVTAEVPNGPGLWTLAQSIFLHSLALGHEPRMTQLR